jgi:hypothetical protein
MSKVKAYIAQARNSGAPENLITRYEIYASNWGNDNDLKTFNEWLAS